MHQQGSERAVVWLPVHTSAAVRWLLLIPVAALSVSCSRPASSRAEPPPLSQRPGAAAIDAAQRLAGIDVVLGLLDTFHKFDRGGRDHQAQSVSFQLPEAVVNLYLQYSLKKAPRPGVRGATVSFLPNNRVSALLLLDFDAVEKWNPGLIPAPLRPVLTASTPIQADFVFEVRDGVLTFTLKQARAQGQRESLTQLMQQLIPLLAAHQPEKYDASKPFPLPFGIRKMWTESNMLAGAT